MDTCAERLEEECIVYNNAASAEEERTVLLANVLSMSIDANGVGLNDFNHDDDGAIHRLVSCAGLSTTLITELKNNALDVHQT